MKKRLFALLAVLVLFLSACVAPVATQVPPGGYDPSATGPAADLGPADSTPVPNAPVEGTFTAADIDRVIGQNNWFCFPDRLDAIGVRSWPLGGKIDWPLSSVDKGSKYVRGEVVPGTGGATAWLSGTLPASECPGVSTPPTPTPTNVANATEVPLTATPTATPASSSSISEMLDAMLPGQWTRFDDRRNAVAVNATESWDIQYPVALCQNQGVDYTDVCPLGSSTAWLTENTLVEPE